MIRNFKQHHLNCPSFAFVSKWSSVDFVQNIYQNYVDIN